VPVDETTLGINESPGAAVQPESLFEAQLALRLGGAAPAWVARAREEWAGLQKESLPACARGGDDTRWVARKRLNPIQWILDTPMRKELYDAED
jgi:hypothetical protein